MATRYPRATTTPQQSANARDVAALQKANPLPTNLDSLFSGGKPADKPVAAPTPVPAAPAPMPAAPTPQPDDGTKVLTQPYTPAQQSSDENRIIADRTAQAQGVIDAINTSFANDISVENRAGAVREQETNAENVARGIMGSPDAASALESTRSGNRGAVAKIEASRASAIATLLQQIDQNAITEARTEHQDAVTQAQTVQTNKTTQQANAKTIFSQLATQGVSLDDFKTKDPNRYAQLLQQTGWDDFEATMQYNDAKSAATAIQWSDKATHYDATRGVMVMVGIDPVTKQMVEKDFPVGGTAATSGGFVPKMFGKQLFLVPRAGIDATKPLDSQMIPYGKVGQFAPTAADQNAANAVGITDPTAQAYANDIMNGSITSVASVPAKYKDAVATILDSTDKGAYPPLAASRFTMAANRIVANYIDMPAYKLTAGGQLYLGRIAAAMQTPGSISDQDLLDSLTKLNTGGNAVTDAQVKLITDGKSFADAASVWANKLQNGGVLSDSQRQQIQTIAQNIFDNYQKQYQPIYNQATAQLKAAGIPKAFWTIPDLNSLTSQSGVAGAGGSDSGSFGAGDTIYDDSGNSYTVGDDGQTLRPEGSPGFKSGSGSTSFNSTAKTLAEAIKTTESGGNYSAKGASGEFGAYQFLKSTWESWSHKYLGWNAPMTPQNQDKVATAHITELLSQGYTPKQVALIWNGGTPQIKKGVNKYGVRYDSGAYANKVLENFNKG